MLFLCCCLSRNPPSFFFYFFFVSKCASRTRYQCHCPLFYIMHMNAPHMSIARTRQNVFDEKPKLFLPLQSNFCLFVRLFYIWSANNVLYATTITPNLHKLKKRDSGPSHITHICNLLKIISRRGEVYMNRGKGCYGFYCGCLLMEQVTI